MRDDQAIVDTSLAIKWVLAEADSPNAEALLAQWIADKVVVLAPALLAYEVANAVHQRVRSGDMSPDNAEQALRVLHAIGIIFEYPQEPSRAAALSMRAIAIAREFGLGPAYGTQFLALAEQEDCEYWTADKSFWTTVRKRYPRVRSLDEYQPPGEGESSTG